MLGEGGRRTSQKSHSDKRREKEICDRNQTKESGNRNGSIFRYTFSFSLSFVFSLFLLCFLLPHSSFFEFAIRVGGSGNGFLPGDWNWNFGSERRMIVDVDFVRAIDGYDSLLGFWFLFLRSVCGSGMEEKDRGRWFAVSSTTVALFWGISADRWRGFWDFVMVEYWLAMPWPMGPFGCGSWWIWLFFPLNLSNFKRSNAKKGWTSETMFWTLNLSMWWIFETGINC